MSLITDALQKTQPRPTFEPLWPQPSRPRRRRWWLYVCVAEAVGLVVLWTWWPFPPARQPVSTQTPDTGPEPTAPPQPVIPATVPEPTFAVSEPAPAPEESVPRSQPVMTLLPAAPSTPAMTWKVDGVIVGLGKPTAIVSGRVVEEGGEVRGAKVVRVNTDRVELLHNGETVSLPVGSEDR